VRNNNASEPIKVFAAVLLNWGLKMKRLIFVGVSLFLASGAFAQAEKFADIADANANAVAPEINLGDGRIYELQLTVDYGEKQDLQFGFQDPDDPCPKNGVCPYIFETTFEEGDDTFNSFQSELVLLSPRDYKMGAPNKAEVTFSSVLLGEDINARWTRTGPVSRETFTDQIVPPDNNEFADLEIVVERQHSAEAYAELVGLDTGRTHATNGFMGRGNFRAINIVLPEN
jgi:hypothetical protein